MSDKTQQRDPKKCICGGDGWYVVGRGTLSPCKYHSFNRFRKNK